MSTKKTDQSGDEWDDMLSDRAPNSVSPDMVRKLLEMNPALRERGMNTSVMLDQANKAQAQQEVAQKRGDTKPASVAVTKSAAKPAAPAADVVAMMAALKTRQAEETRRIDDELAKLKKAREALAASLQVELSQWLLANDPDMRSPVTQSVLDREKGFLGLIGFTVKAYVDERMKKR